MSLIEKLTPEQEALIPVYRQKWRAIALSTERIDREKAAEAVKIAYEVLGLHKPRILFFDSPLAAFKSVNANLKNSYSNLEKYWYRWNLPKHLLKTYHELFNKILNWLEELLSEDLFSFLSNELYFNLDICFFFWQQVIQHLITQEDIPNEVLSFLESDMRVEPEEWIQRCCLIEIGFVVFNAPYNSTGWQLLRGLVENCGWVYPFKEICIVCDRPLHLRFDNQNRLHAEGEPTIEFIDGYSLYSYHGVTLPEKYGKSHPQQWQSQWLLSEENAELRRVLIEGIGYARICEELQAIELDSWQEYTLLKIDADVDEEPIYLLKMTCPSTSFIHALRVPPNMNSAHEAISWVNWGVDPEEFGVQT
jgi:hypothetical protein